MILDRYHYYDSHHVVKYGFTNKTLVFKEIEGLMLKFSVIIINIVKKTFQTDLSSLVNKNNNFTNELKSESEHLISDYFGSLKDICKSLKNSFESAFLIKQLKIGFLLM